MSNPSYMPDDVSIDTETDNSHIFDAEIDDFSVAELDTGITLVKVPESYDIESELSRLRTDNPHPRNKFGLSAFANLVLTKVAESDAGNMASHGFWLIDKYHASDAETLQQARFMNLVSNAQIDGKSVAERIEAGQEQVFDAVYKLAEDFNALRNNDLPSYDDYEEARDSDLRAMTDYAVKWKTVYQVYMGARVEELAGEVLCEALGIDEWYAHSDKVKARTEYDNPESAGIDLYLPEIDRTVQVKRGDGGELKNCEADWVVRYLPADNDGKSGRSTRLKVIDNR